MLFRLRLVLLVALSLQPMRASGQPSTMSSGPLRSFVSDTELERYLTDLQKTVARPQHAPAAAVECSGSSVVSQRTPAAPGIPPGSRHTIVHGRALNAATGLPLASVDVSLTELTSGSYSTESGEYTLVVPDGSLAAAESLTVRARRVGYSPLSHTVSVAPGDSVRIEFRMCAQLTQLSEVVVAGPEASVTNVQHAGVDEGGIVKLHGDYLVILRRGRLFTVRVGRKEMRPIAVIDAFAPGTDPSHAWYDEMLVSGDQVVVIGYSYWRDATEVGLFQIGRDGSLRYRATYHLRSNDYYSSRNYASRLIGDRLIFYTPSELSPRQESPLAALPAMRKWRNPVDSGSFEKIVTPHRVYRAEGPWSSAGGVTLHTVTTCQLGGREMECDASVVVGPPGRVFYVSPSAVYVWATSWDPREHQLSDRSLLYRMPLDGSAPAALSVSGGPVDQFSFLESSDRHLNVVVRADSDGDGMWQAERSAGAVALLRIPIAMFGDGQRAVPNRYYKPLPTPPGKTFQNRFVGDHLLYGSGNGWWHPRQSSSDLYVLRWRGGPVTHIRLKHAADRIESIGSDAVVVGADTADLHFSGIRLGRTQPAVAQRFVLRDASQGELRSHGFFYRVDGAQRGVLGLPVARPGRAGYEHLFEESAAVLYLKNENRRFVELGELHADPASATDDGCVASCVDWYGNSRPLFVRGRMFALLGYELVEGRIRGGRIEELRRITYAPRREQAAAP